MTPERRREIEALNTARTFAWCVRKDPGEQPVVHGHVLAFIDCPVGHVHELLTELDRLQAELHELRAEIHSGHILIPFDERYHQSLCREHSRASSDRLGWLICTRDGCGYEVPSHGWCFHHRVLDACWAYTERKEASVDGEGLKSSKFTSKS